MKRAPIQVAVLIAFAASLVFAGRALAHALLLRSIPEANAELNEPPKTIELWFSEPLEDGFSLARLITTSGDEITLGAHVVDINDPTHLTVSVGALNPGIYTVAWSNLSRTDGHAWVGSFPFTILNPDGSRPSGAAQTLDLTERSKLPSPLQTAARWLTLTGGILLLGLALFLSYVAAEWTQSDPELKTRLDQLGIRLLALTVLGIALGSWLQFVAQALELESLTVLPRLVSATYGGALNLSRQAFSVTGLLIVLWLGPRPMPSQQKHMLTIAATYLAALLALIAWTIFQGQAQIAALTLLALGVLALLTLGGMALLNRPQPGANKRWDLLLLSGSAALLCFSVGSHAGAVPGSFWAIAFDLIHLLATSAWLGGLMLLPLMLNRGSTDPASLRPLFRRYGQMAKFSFFVLWTTGLLNSLVHIPSLESLVNTSYGQVLLIKIALMLLVWGLSMAGSRVFRGRPDPAQVSALLQKFTRLARIAAWTGLALMLSVAVLAQTQPPSKESAPQNETAYENSVEADDLSIHLEVTPAQIGLNQFYVHLSHADRSSIGEVQLVRLMFDEQDSQLGQAQIEMKPFGPNGYWIDGAFLNRPGNWKISVYVRRRGLDDLITDVGAVILASPPTQKETLFQNPVTSIPLGGLLTGILILIGVEIFRWRFGVFPRQISNHTYKNIDSGSTAVITNHHQNPPDASR